MGRISAGRNAAGCARFWPGYPGWAQATAPSAGAKTTAITALNRTPACMRCPHTVYTAQALVRAQRSPSPTKSDLIDQVIMAEVGACVQCWGGRKERNPHRCWGSFFLHWTL